MVTVEVGREEVTSDEVESGCGVPESDGKVSGTEESGNVGVAAPPLVYALQLLLPSASDWPLR